MNEFLQSLQGFNGQQIINPIELIHSIANAEGIDDLIKQDALEEIAKAELELLGG
ncbi:hypothetical protein D3C80_1823220 [compost metagenome]